MKVTHITDIDKFFEVIDSCKSRTGNRRGRQTEPEIQTFPVCISCKHLFRW